MGSVMKSFAFVMLMTVQVMAQTNETTLSSTQKSSISSEASVNSSSVDTSDVKANSFKQRFSINFYTLGGYDIHQFDKPRPSYAVYDSYFSFNIKTSQNLAFSAMPTFGYTTDGRDYQGKEVTDKVIIRDFSFAMTMYNVFEDNLPTALDYKIKSRLYLPTSDGSKAEGMIARLRLENEMKYYLDNGTNFRMYVKPSYYFQRSTSYVDNTNPNKEKAKSTRLADSQHGAEYNYKINQYFSLLPAFEIEDKWSFASDSNKLDQRHENTIAYRFGIEVRPFKSFNFTVGYEDKRDLIQRDRDAQLGYSLLTNLNIF